MCTGIAIAIRDFGSVAIDIAITETYICRNKIGYMLVLIFFSTTCLPFCSCK